MFLLTKSVSTLLYFLDGLLDMGFHELFASLTSIQYGDIDLSQLHAHIHDSTAFCEDPQFPASNHVLQPGGNQRSITGKKDDSALCTLRLRLMRTNATTCSVRGRKSIRLLAKCRCINPRSTQMFERLPLTRPTSLRQILLIRDGHCGGSTY